MRHRKENLKKCSLRSLEDRLDMRFFTYPYLTPSEKDPLPPLENYILLTLNAPPLDVLHDADKGLFLIDSTWRYSYKMLEALPQTLIHRTLPPHIRTAYPRYQTACCDPLRGLASVEALYTAYILLNRPTDGLLDHYHWKAEFLALNELTL